MAAKDDLGRAGEERATEFLRGQGWEICDRNWRCAQGELDIVALRGAQLAFVEVKTRRSLAFGHPFEAIDARKARRLWQLAYAWMHVHPERARGRTARVHAIGIVGDDPRTAMIEHLEDVR